MNHLLFVLLSFAGIDFFENENDYKGKKVMRILYITVIGVVLYFQLVELVYDFGKFVGEMTSSFLY